MMKMYSHISPSLMNFKKYDAAHTHIVHSLRVVNAYANDRLSALSNGINL